MGGFGAFQLGCFAPEIFDAIVSVAGYGLGTSEPNSGYGAPQPASSNWELHGIAASGLKNLNTCWKVTWWSLCQCLSWDVWSLRQNFRGLSRNRGLQAGTSACCTSCACTQRRVLILRRRASEHRLNVEVVARYCTLLWGIRDHSQSSRRGMERLYLVTSQANPGSWKHGQFGPSWEKEAGFKMAENTWKYCACVAWLFGQVAVWFACWLHVAYDVWNGLIRTSNVWSCAGKAITATSTAHCYSATWAHPKAFCMTLFRFRCSKQVYQNANKYLW